MAERVASRDVSAAGYDHGKLLAGILILLVAEREDRAAGEGGRPAKTEVLLRKAGFSGPEIASLTGKNAAAVRKTLERSRG